MRKLRLPFGEAGQSIVEFSLVIVVFFILVMGLVEAGRAVWNYNTLSNSVREGARYGIVHGSASSSPAGPAANNAAIQTQVRNFSSGLNHSRLTVTSSWPDGNNQAGSRVTVTGSYQFQTLFSVAGIPNITMTSSSTMTITN
jgi:Flp pilus assembly protein TadG